MSGLCELSVKWTQFNIRFACCMQTETLHNWHASFGEYAVMQSGA